MFGDKRNNSIRFIGVLMLLAALYVNTQAQANIQFSQGKIEEGMSNSISVPLMSYKGRGINLPVTLNYSSNVWRIDNLNTVCNNPCVAYQTMTQAIYAEHSTAGWKSSLDIPKIEFPKSTDTYYSTGGEYCYVCGSGAAQFRIARVFVHMPDGSTHELRKSDARYSGSIDMSGTFYAVDSSRLRYDGTDADTGTLYLPDGTRYVLDAGSAQLIDSNGNTLNYDGTHREWTDTLGRVIAMPIPANPQAQDYTYNLPGLAGVNNGLQTYTFKWRKLEDALTPDANNNTPALRVMASHYLQYPNSAPTAQNGNNYPQAQSADSLFHYDAPDGASVYTLVVGHEQTQGQRFNPIVLTEIVLPDGASYKFSYNIYGEIDKVIYPTGAFEKYQIEPVTGSWNLSVPYNQANRGVTSRKLSINGTGNDILDWKYSKQEVGFGSWGTGVEGADVYKVIAPDNTRTEVYKIKIQAPMHAPPNYREYWDFGFVDAKNGATVEKRVYSTADGGWTGGALLRRELTEYERTAAYQMTLPNGLQVYAYRNVRPTKSVSLIFEGSSSALAQTNTFVYDTTYEMTTGVDQTRANTYHYAVVNNTSSGDTAQSGTINQIPTGSLANYSETTYLNDSVYRNANILGLRTAIKLRDGAGTLVSQSELAYDEPGYSPAVGRGLTTSTKVWDSTKGTATNPSAYVLIRATFDTYGNQTTASDAMGNPTTTVYDSTYHAFPVSVTTAAPDQNGGTYGSTTGFTTSIAYDTSTPPLGLPMSMTDANGQITYMQYNDALLRPTKVIAPNDQQTITEYGAGTSQSTRYVKVKTQIDNDNWSEAYNWYDAIGRTYKSETVNAQGNISVVTCYDLMGRIAKTSNASRNIANPNCSSSLKWTTRTYDDLGRVISTTLPDSSTVQTVYGLSTSGVTGMTKTITDQAGRKRKGITDAFGRMTRVIEDPDGQNLSTDYVFDTLGNLRKTAQGEQNRYFMYDSIGRLLYAKQPEQAANTNFSGANYADPITGNNQWSVKYVHDDNGNIVSTTDSRNITITATYDKLNRLVFRNYSDSTTPNVSLFYDGKGLPSVPAYSKGKTTKVSSSVSETRYTGFDNSGRLLSHEQITDGRIYETSYSYNLSGALIEEVYPSGRVVKNTVNQDGELSMVQSRKSNTGFWAYAAGFSYNPAGGIEKMRLGNGFWETTQYNERLQIIQTGLGTTDGSPNLLKLEFGYSTPALNDNNGSMKSQKITVPALGGNLGFAANQTYTYDSLNRLQSASETISNNQIWKQTFAYDRYGNRRFETTNNNTTTLSPSLAAKVTNPLINTSDNRFQKDQDNDNITDYNYDANGNLTLDAENKRFVYNAENRQTQFFRATNNTSTPDATYYYDGEGKRVKKISNTETVIFVYDAQGRLVAEYSTVAPTASQVSYLTTDHLGSPRIITNQNCEILNRKDYSAFGEETVSAQRTSLLGYPGQNEIRQGYTGYQKEDESGLNYAQARYYHSGHGRFMNVDPLTASLSIRNPQTFNRYSYVINSPYKFADPLGLSPADMGVLQTTNGFEAHYADLLTRMNFWGAMHPTRPDPGKDGNVAVAAAQEQEQESEQQNLTEAQVRAWFPGFNGDDLRKVEQSITDSRKAVGGMTPFATILIAKFRGAGDTATPEQATDALDATSGIEVTTYPNGTVKELNTIQNVFDGRTSTYPIYPNGVQNPSVTVAEYLRRNPSFSAITYDGYIFLNQGFFDRTRDERAKDMTHESVVHRTFNRRDREFDPMNRQIEGSHAINAVLDSFYRRH